MANKQKMIIGTLLASLILLVLFSSEFNKTYEETVKDIHFNGVVKRKYIDSENHSQTKIVLASGQSVYVNNEIYDKTQLGDSIFKRSGSHYVYLLNSAAMDSIMY
uniref:hypothetical protein n=1 Tax=Fulvivirga sp. TaxID=1931237 RepID=UPI004049B2FC